MLTGASYFFRISTVSVVVGFFLDCFLSFRKVVFLVPLACSGPMPRKMDSGRANRTETMKGKRKKGRRAPAWAVSLMLARI